MLSKMLPLVGPELRGPEYGVSRSEAHASNGTLASWIGDVRHVSGLTAAPEEAACMAIVLSKAGRTSKGRLTRVAGLTPIGFARRRLAR